MSTIHFVTHPMLAAFRLPSSAAAARLTARRLNAAGSRSVRGRGPRLDVSAIYRKRATGATTEATPAPGRPRTLAQLATAYYSAPGASALIPASARGGAR